MYKSINILFDDLQQMDTSLKLKLSDRLQQEAVVIRIRVIELGLGFCVIELRFLLGVSDYHNASPTRVSRLARFAFEFAEAIDEMLGVARVVGVVVWAVGVGVAIGSGACELVVVVVVVVALGEAVAGGVGDWLGGDGRRAESAGT